MGKALNLREWAFVDAFVGRAKGNATEAARIARYAPTSRKAAAVKGSQLLRNPKIQRAIFARVERREKVTDFNAIERDKLTAKIAIENQHTNPGVSLRAIAELNKCSGRHAVKVNLDVTETIVDIVARSREL